MEYLLQQYQLFMEISKSNPFMSGLIAVWGATAVTWALRNVPSRIFKFIESQCTTRLIFNNTGWTGNDLHFLSFMKWFAKSGFARMSRDLAMEGYNRKDGQTGALVGIGYGNHIFFYKRRLFWVNKTRLESTGVSQEKQQFIITGLTRNHQIFNELVEEFRYRDKPNELSVYHWRDNCWSNPTAVHKRPIETVIVAEDIKTKILGDITYFINNEAWYRTRGMPYKMTYVLHGKPGTGKTSLVKTLASHFNRNVYAVNLGMMSDNSFEHALTTVPPRSIILIEDFDTTSAVKARSGSVPYTEPHGDNDTPAPTHPGMGSGEQFKITQDGDSLGFSLLSLSGILNVLDGVVSLNDTIVMMTTNHIENIDDALLRKGRVDHIVEIPYLTDTEVKAYVQMMFPDATIDQSVNYAVIAGCDLQALFLEYKEDYHGFVNSIPRGSVIN